MEHREQIYVGGAWSAPLDGQPLELVSPATGQTFASVPAAGVQDVDRAVLAARAAFDEGPWPQTDPAERVAALRRLIERYDPRRREIAQLITQEMGAPISFSKFSQAKMPLFLLNAFAAIGEGLEWEERRKGFFGQEIVVRKEPAGVVAAIVPWNMPMHLLVGKLGPAIVAGCPIVIKPAPETPLDALLLAEIVDEIGLPPCVVSILPGGNDIGRALVEHPGVDRVSFTGSTAAGREIASVCGRQLKKASLELGGKSAAIVLEDADPAAIAEGIKLAGLMNSGQTCVAQTRVLVPAARQREYVDAIAAMVEGLVTGDPMDPATEVGPLVAERQRDRVRGYIEAGRSEGARLVVGGADAPDGLDEGWYVRPTLFADVDNGMTIAREEIFGPVLSLIPYRDEADAIRLANDSEYGLSGSVWTADRGRGLEVARRIRTGSFGVNEPYSMDPFAPFGGVKASGMGREHGPEGIDGYLDTKVISGAG